MEVKLYVGNLSFQTGEEQLREMFAEAGTVNLVELIKDRTTGQSRGFAFVTMASQSDAANAIRMFNGKSVDNRELRVNTATAREDRPSYGSGRNSNYSSREKNRRY